MLSALPRILIAWLAGTATAYLLASVAHTQTVLAGLSGLDVPIGWSERVAMTAGDLAGLWRYALVIGIGLALGLLAMRVLPRRFPPLSAAARAALAGALAMAVILGAMRIAFSFAPIASAREWPGFALQCLAGAAGGWVHARLRATLSPRTRTGPATPART